MFVLSLTKISLVLYEDGQNASAVVFQSMSQATGNLIRSDKHPINGSRHPLSRGSTGWGYPGTRPSYLAPPIYGRASFMIASQASLTLLPRLRVEPE